MKKWIQAAGITTGILGVGVWVATIPLGFGVAILATLLFIAVTGTIRTML